MVPVGWAAGFARHRSVSVWSESGDCGARLAARTSSATPGGRRSRATWPHRTDCGGRVRLLLTDESDLLATWGLLRPRVLLPPHAREWPDDRIRIVLCHELAHVRRHDWFVQITAEAVRIAFWFNPLIWIACTRLRRDSEQACDDVGAGTTRPGSRVRRPPAGSRKEMPEANIDMGIGGADGSSVNA